MTFSTQVEYTIANSAIHKIPILKFFTILGIKSTFGSEVVKE